MIPSYLSPYMCMFLNIQGTAITKYADCEVKHIKWVKSWHEFLNSLITVKENMLKCALIQQNKW